MPELDGSSARWLAAPGRGHYESYFLEAVHPGGGRGVWLRCTVRRAPGGASRGAVWAAFVDPADHAPVAVRRDDLPLSAGDGAWIRCGHSAFAPTGATGSVEADGSVVAWELTFATEEPALFHLPQRWMYRARLPRTKLVSPLPAVILDGRVTVNGRTEDVAGWRGVVGHNWGEEHAERWIWLHGVVVEGAHTGSWFDVAAARVRVGGVTLPWTAFGAIRLDDERIPLGGLGRSVTVRASPTECTLVVSGRGVKVAASVSAAAEAFVRWDYHDPSGTRHPVWNCPVADARLQIERRGRSPLELHLDRSGVYEHGHTSSLVAESAV